MAGPDGPQSGHGARGSRPAVRRPRRAAPRAGFHDRLAGGGARPARTSATRRRTASPTPCTRPCSTASGSSCPSSPGRPSRSASSASPPRSTTRPRTTSAWPRRSTSCGARRGRGPHGDGARRDHARGRDPGQPGVAPARAGAAGLAGGAVAALRRRAGRRPASVAPRPAPDAPPDAGSVPARRLRRGDGPRAGQALGRRRPGRGGSRAGGALRAGGEPRGVLAPEPAARAPGRPGVERCGALRRPRHRQDARVRSPPLGHEPRPHVPHRRPVARPAAAAGGPLLRQPGAGGRGEPVRQPPHRPQRAQAARSGAPPRVSIDPFPGTARGSMLPATGRSAPSRSSSGTAARSWDASTSG